MKFIWKGRWKGGEIIVEAGSLQELECALQELLAKGSPNELTERQRHPELPLVKGCAEALRVLMSTEWASEPRSMADIKKALEINGLYFSKGTLSGTLTALVKRGELHRVKENGRWTYIINKASR
ncbi:MAG: hypothetical protein RMJ15_08585 [Nitrososphaerota archaeon]|nr:hypothetical protein [Candidatus Bathyarchaeota archaeon]MDW8023774.1 hypothetical protein [Nitrososphaerota archaeon]